MISVEGKPFSKLDLVRETDNQALKPSCELRRCSSDWLVACFYFVSFLQHILLQTCIFLTDFFALHFFMFNLLQSLSSQPYSIVDLFFFPKALAVLCIFFFFLHKRLSVSPCNPLSTRDWHRTLYISCYDNDKSAYPFEVNHISRYNTLVQLPKWCKSMCGVRCCYPVIFFFILSIKWKTSNLIYRYIHNILI